MALQLLSLTDLQAYSGLAEVQALTEVTLEPLERNAIDLLEGHLGRRVTVDAEPQIKEVVGSGMQDVPLPERLASITSVATDYGDVVTTFATLANDGWMLRFKWYTPHARLNVRGLWGWDPPQKIIDVLMDLVEALAVRKADPVSHRDEVGPWADVSDGNLRTSRGPAADRMDTVENLIRYDLKTRLKGCYRPTRATVV